MRDRRLLGLVRSLHARLAHASHSGRPAFAFAVLQALLLLLLLLLRVVPGLPLLPRAVLLVARRRPRACASGPSPDRGPRVVVPALLAREGRAVQVCLVQPLEQRLLLLLAPRAGRLRRLLHLHPVGDGRRQLGHLR